MEAAASVAAARSVPLPMQSSHPSRKEWRVVSEQSARNASSEVQQGREPVDVDFCSITIDGSSDNDILQKRLHSVGRRKEELQQIEIELRAQIIARSEIMELQNNYDKQIKEHANANVKLQAWAKEDLLREQSKELQSFRRERDNTEAERAQHVKQIHDFQEHFQEKERQLLELQEQHRVAQENILFKDEQLRDAQAWITRVQEMDAVQATANHSLQAELRERTEQYNQLWLGCQRQFAEMERLHLHTVQQLQLELADARGKSGTYPDESHVSQTISKDASQIGQNNGNQLDVNGSSIPVANSGSLPNGSLENVSSFVSAGNASAQADHPHGVPIAPSSLLGMPTYLPAGQVTGLHPYVMHQQGVPHSIPSQVAQSHVGHFHSVPALSPLQHWQNQQASLEGSQVPTQNHYPPSQTDQTLLRSDTNYDYEVSVNGQFIRSEYLDIHVSQGVETEDVIPPAADGGQVFEQVDKSYLVAPQSQQSLQHISSQFHDGLRLDTLSQNSETKEKATATLSNHGLEGQGFTTEQASSGNTASSETQINHMNSSETDMNNATGAVSSEAFVSSRQKNLHMGGKTLELPLLDERSLLACIVRTIPPGSGGRIRISSTLPNRLAKMLAPLHWHDYKKKYGKLDDFVAGHPELFVIEGDDIQVRDGAQEIIAATAAVAKVAAAAKTASSPYSSLLPSVAVTPVAQSNRLKRAPSMDSNSVKSDKTISKEYVAPTPASATDNPSQLSVPNQHSNGVYLNAGGITNIKILSKPKDPLEINDTEIRPGHSSGLVAVGNGANLERSGSSLSKRSTHVKPSANFVGKQQGRATALASNSRR
ncbi:hypothetical protein Acr_18g0005530 [Actinidia rufa]|uniref:DUF7725 domain-containing protein n=1 Tax=Actinidia rufa TaxID=165716 RepID=A0A7J0G6G8_9ERIC|nr:hypothetical protein Acr_18g0005280 [Actinidia rufa]GFZ06383.1 hypothetical protein Acr_18g0005530 [Actinidia rufa]